jgi:hypothetical protein
VGQLHKANPNLCNHKFGHHIVASAPNKPDFTSHMTFCLQKILTKNWSHDMSCSKHW